MNLEKDIIKTVGVLVLKGKDVLLVEHGEDAGHLTGTYGIIAGRIGEGESDKQAALRELREESGLETEENFLIEVPDKEYVADIERKGGEIKRFSLKLFVCMQYSGELKDEFETVPRWENIKDIYKLRLLPNVDKMVEDGKKIVEEMESNKEMKVLFK